MSWTDERVELLKKLWADGLSASQIAGELGGITRNAVIGKVHRLGLSGRAKSPSSAAQRPRKARAPHMMRVARPVIRGNTVWSSGGDGTSTWDGREQVVLLDFDTYTKPLDHQYTQAERDAIQVAADQGPGGDSHGEQLLGHSE